MTQIYWRHENQHNDTQHSDSRHNDTQHNETQHNGTQYKSQLTDTQNKNILYGASLF